VKILIAEDDKITRALLVRWVTRWGYEPVVAQDGVEALNILLSDMSVQLCVMDWMMPGLNGPEVCRQLRAQREEPYVYTTLLTGKTETDDVVEGLRSGADDYIQKPCHPLELEVRLRVGKRLVDLQSKLIETREKLRIEATHDALTHLWNRRAVVDELGKRLISSRENQRPLCVVMVDIDHFKLINDTYGHSAGDAVLREVARRFTAELQAGDGAGRYGGEEFMLMLSDCNLEFGQVRSEEIRRSLADVPVRVGPLSIPISASFGVASTSQSRHADLDLLTRAADAALYRSKRGGRNRVSLAEIREFDRPSLQPPLTLPVDAA
jgi:two-component system, cell cycle response regulator